MLIKYLAAKVFALFLLIVCLLGSWTQSLTAQEDISFDIDTWLKFSSRAERVVANQAASDKAFLDLQSQLVNWQNQAQSQFQPTQAELTRIMGRLEALEGSIQATTEEQTSLDRLFEELNTKLREAEIRFGLIKDVQQETEALIEEINQILSARSSERFYSV